MFHEKFYEFIVKTDNIGVSFSRCILVLFWNHSNLFCLIIEVGDFETWWDFFSVCVVEILYRLFHDFLVWLMLLHLGQTTLCIYLDKKQDRVATNCHLEVGRESRYASHLSGGCAKFGKRATRTIVKIIGIVIP